MDHTKNNKKSSNSLSINESDTSISCQKHEMVEKTTTRQKHMENRKRKKSQIGKYIQRAMIIHSLRLKNTHFMVFYKVQIQAKTSNKLHC